MSKDYKHTLLMMKTAFPMRGNLPETELKIEKEWEENNLYHLVLQKNINNPPFILHDGPFYAHGEVHVGHAFNKILKDFVIRYRTMSNYYAPFIPGWDMHGLPIENELIKEGKVSRDNPVAFRHRCREYAYEQLEKQRHTFKRLGILGEWEQPYLTSKNEYVAEQIKMFAHLVKKNLIYKGLKPVYWSPDSGTLLTETEVEYFDKITPSIYFTFQVIDGRNVISDDCELVVWTTSPWTVPANVAICVNPEFQYAVIETEERYLIVASELTDSFIAETQLNGYKIIKLIQGKDLEYITYRHPLNNNIYSVVLGECVNLDAGTGLVHIAPGHGYEDFLIAKKYKLDIVTVLDTKGFLTKETGEFDGIYYEEANRVITLRLKEVNRLVYSGKTVHNYPYDIKNRKPVVYRAVWQWFASIEALREELLDAVKSVNWIPSWGESRIENIIKESGEWCISRQRVWGVPIPVFYAEDGTTLLNPDLINYVAEIFRREGPSAWWRRSAKELLPEGFVSPHSPNGIFIKENDIMDVWFDAGSYHHAAMVSDGYSYPAQLYLESSNQYRGWFNSSLITGVALTGKAPYKTVLTHGFVLDGAGHKMNKTSDTLNPTELVARYGADVLRLWVASVDYTSDVRISPPILKQTEEIYRKIRNTFRFLLGNLFDFRNSKNHIKYELMPEMCQIMVNLLNVLIEKVLTAYEHYQFFEVYRLIKNYITNDLSAFFLEYTKDILYVDAADTWERRSVQTVLYDHLLVLLRLLTPIIPHTTEEVYKYIKGKKETSIYLLKMPMVMKFANSNDLSNKYEIFQELRRDILKALEAARFEKIIGRSLQAKIEIKPTEKIRKLINGLNDRLDQLFIVSEFVVTNEEIDGQEYESGIIKVTACTGKKCERCRKVVADISGEKLCKECERIINK